MLYVSTWKKLVEELKEFKPEGNDNVQELDIEYVAREGLVKYIEAVMAHEVQVHMGVMPYERNPDERDDYLNGSYVRHLLTTAGDIKVNVPRTRSGKFKSKTLRAYKRRGKKVDAFILGCFVNGVSTRKVGEITEEFLGERVSRSTVSRICKMLDGLVKAYHSRKLEDKYLYLLLDGVYLKVRGAIKTIRKCVLVAYGITKDGIREVLDFRLTQSESEAEWERFLTDLYTRGMEGKKLRLIATDGGKGLLAALDTVWGKVARQGCWAHKARNVMDKVRKSDQKAVKSDLAKISHAETTKSAAQAYWKFSMKWNVKYPKAVKSLATDFDSMLEYLKTPEPHWIKLRTTNAIERLFREVRRRIRPMGVCSNNESIERILYAIFTNANKKFQDAPLIAFTHK